MGRICFYISGHGLGHASRSGRIINTLRRRRPGIAVEVITDAPGWFLKSFLDPSVPVRCRRLDIGVLQQDSLVMCEEKTLLTYREFFPERERIVAEEARRLRRRGVDLVAADIPPAAFAAAAAAGVRSVGISNFSWDWIYQGMAEKFSGYGDVLRSVCQDYRCADLLLRLPFHGDFPSFDHIEDLPLVARKATLKREEARLRLAIPPGLKVGLISFGGFGLAEFDFAPLERLSDWLFLTEKRLAASAANLRVIPEGLLPYPDLVAVADAVVTKPGYGIVSEAIAHGTAVLYTSRGDFREQALLVDGLHRYTRALEIDNEELRRGAWGDFLEALLAQPAPRERLRCDGDVVAADRLAELAA